jgi:hypothetical protein
MIIKNLRNFVNRRINLPGGKNVRELILYQVVKEITETGLPPQWGRYTVYNYIL